MAQDCLHTALKATATGSSLQKMGCLYLDVKAVDTISSTAQQKLQVRAYPGNSVVVNALDGGYFALTAAGLDVPADRLTTKTIAAADNLVDMYFVNGNYRVEITNKYGIYFLYAGSASAYKNIFTLNIEELAWTKMQRPDIYFSDSYGDIATLAALNLLSVDIRDCKAFGDISAFSAKTSLQGIAFIGNQNVYGSISSLGNLTSITRLDLSDKIYPEKFLGSINDLGKLTNMAILSIKDTKVNGEIVTFVTSQIANGRTTRDTSTPLRCDNIIKNCTFNGTIRNIETHSAPTYMTWASASKITVYDKCNGTNLNNAAVIYALGATAGEISAWEAAGKEVIVVD